MKWTRKRTLNLVILAAFLVVFITVISLPDDAYGDAFIHTSGVGTGYLPMTLTVPNEPTISFKLSVELASIGGLSAGKDIYMKVLVKDITPANWNDTYCCLAIVSGGSLGLPPAIYLSPAHPSLLPSSPPFSLYRFSNGTYYTDGHFYVTEPVPIWVGFGNPAWNQTQVAQAVRSQLTPVANVTGTVSDSQAITLNEVTIKIGFIVGSFSILAVQPVLKGIFLEEKK